MLADNKTELYTFEEQLNIFHIAESSSVHLSDILRDAKLSYNDLVYYNSYSKNYKKVRPLGLSDFCAPSRSIPVVSFFSGCGGLDLGLEAAGFSHLACVEINETFCKTIRRNRPTWTVFGPPVHSGDVSEVDKIIPSLEAMITSPFEGLFVGGPPCQPFSIAANQRFAKSGDKFKRIGFAHEKNGNLLFDFISLIKHFRPLAFLIENVPGLRDIDKGVQIKEAISELTANGYSVQEPFTIDASNYGVPQQRIRLFIVGSRREKSFVLPTPQDGLTGCGNVLCDKSLDNLANTEIRQHNTTSVSRYCMLDYGQRDQLGRVDRLDPSLPSKTVIAGGTNGGGRSHLHPEIPRTLSVRESARLQTFPDDFIFLGPTARQFTQVGNAVPPVLAAQISNAILKSFF